jgi:hypothetical protein
MYIKYICVVFQSLSVILGTAEQSRAVAYCRQPASTVTPGIEPPGTHGHIFVQCQDFFSLLPFLL